MQKFSCKIGVKFLFVLLHQFIVLFFYNNLLFCFFIPIFYTIFVLFRYRHFSTPFFYTNLVTHQYCLLFLYSWFFQRKIEVLSILKTAS